MHGDWEAPIITIHLSERVLSRSLYISTTNILINKKFDCVCLYVPDNLEMISSPSQNVLNSNLKKS